MFFHQTSTDKNLKIIKKLVKKHNLNRISLNQPNIVDKLKSGIIC